MEDTIGIRIVVHGGAGRIDPERHVACRHGCEAAASAGWTALDDGGDALEAVETAVRALENDPEFNAGTGSALRDDGRVQMDAAVMRGRDRRAGAVALIERLAHPVSAARAVLDDGRHVLMAGTEAERLAVRAGIAACEPDNLVVERERAHWERSHGTVGAVALDKAGGLAAATSTGGQANALPGRIGDSPLIGAGTYADRFAAVSCTGPGEAILRTVMAHAAAADIAHGGQATGAGERALARLRSETGAKAGLIGLDSRGRCGFARTTPHMPFSGITASVCVPSSSI